MKKPYRSNSEKPRLVPRLATARANSSPSRAVRSFKTARPSDSRASISMKRAGFAQSGAQNSARASCSSSTPTPPSPAPTARTVKGKLAPKPLAVWWRRVAAPAKATLPSSISTKSHGFTLPFLSNPVVAFGPPAGPGANCPIAAVSIPGEGMSKSDVSSSLAASFDGVPDSASNKPLLDTRWRMKLFVKSRCPSFPPVPSSWGYFAVAPVNTSAASIHPSAVSGRSPRSAPTNSALVAPAGLSFSPNRVIVSDALRMPDAMPSNRRATEAALSGPNPSLLSLG